LKNEVIEDSFTAKGLKAAKRKLDVMKLSEKEQLSYKYYLESLHDRASFYESTYVQGEKKGRKEGMEEGIKEGIKKGIKKGIKEGIQEALKKMITSGIPVDEAKRILGCL
ncbi:MAG: hypothetical protein QME42_11395, partial [bacterium]|nr:hypothetical protein [bacterium]